MSVLIFGSGGGGGGEGVDLSLDTVRPKYVLSPYRFHDNRGIRREGEIPHWNGLTQAGASQDGNKVTISPTLQPRHIPAGSYLGRDIELAPMPMGSATMEWQTFAEGDVITLTKEAGYIPGGTETIPIPMYDGDTVFMPGADTIHVPVANKYSRTGITIFGDPNLDPANIRKGASIFGVNGSYTEEPLFAEYSLIPGNSKTWEISLEPPSLKPYMFGFICGSTTTDQVVSGMGYRDKSTVRTYVAGRGAGNVITANWYSNSVVLTIGGNYNYVFNTGALHTVWLAYKVEDRTL